ncbi:uncharacterized protein LOC118648534 [Monomorium pharaonis]|uniref:uncharacterized protein LOC118648534 n=1 Tax=Monomorium pharaonis TaxID=307658 RepID=UPI0017476581|nr:uncharacterized protein LOC118648534 [Monomorium pharaonis]
MREIVIVGVRTPYARSRNGGNTDAVCRRNSSGSRDAKKKIIIWRGRHNTKQYRYPPIHKDEIDRQVGELLKNDVIKPSTSPYNSPLWIVPKKADSKGNKRWRLVIDFRSLNEKTLGDAYPLPNITEILDQLGSAKYFSVFDLASGFHQIPMHESDAPKTAFSTPFGHYEYKRMPFGLKNAPATFQRLMDLVLSGLQGITLFVYLDDVVIYASSLKEHKKKFNQLAERLRQANLKLQPDKCEFLRKEVTYLGHVINENGVKPDPKKIEAVMHFPHPKNTKNIREFLGLAGYYRRFIPNFSCVAKPLTNLLKKDEPFAWQQAQEIAFTTLRKQLCSEPLLQHPDFTKPFILTTDASGYAIGGILSQGDIGRDLPIAYTSRLLNTAEQNYSTIEKELLAIVYSTHYFRPYLYGNKFKLVTDHKPLVWMHSVKDPTSRLMRWRLKLAEYEFEIVYKAGKTNVNADALSRNPVIKRDIQDTTAVLPLEAFDSDDEPIFDKPSRGNNKTTGPTDRRPDEKQTYKNTRTKSINTNEQQKENVNIEYENENESMDVMHEGMSENEIYQACEIESEASEKEGDDATDTGSETSGSESDDANETESEDELFDSPDVPYSFKGRFAPPTQQREAIINVTRDNFLAQNDNLVIFTTQRGDPCDRGAKILKETNLLPETDKLTLGRARPLPRKNHKHLIMLAVKERMPGNVDRTILNETISSLLDVVNELGLFSFSICRGDLDNIKWLSIYSLLESTFTDSRVTITVCTNQVRIPPEEQREEIIRENHCSTIGGHKGTTKTYKRIRYNFQWPRMKSDINNFIQRCRNCQIKKLVRRKVKQPMTLTDTPDAAFDKVSMDLMGPLPPSRNGNIYIFTIQDLLTKYSLAIPLRGAGAVEVTNALIENFVCTFGAPKAILTDQGTQFLSILMKTVARKFKINKYTTTAYRPQANGSVERSHHVLWEYLKQVVENKENWDEYLALASFSYNTSVHEGTGYTPHELVFGKIARTPTSEPPPEDLDNESYANYLTNLFNKLRDVQTAAHDNLVSAKRKSKNYYDRRVRPRHFEPGDEVYLLKEPTHKLGDQYTGPYKICEILDNHNVKLEISPRRFRIVHADKLKGGKPVSIPTTTQRESSPSREDADALGRGSLPLEDTFVSRKDNPPRGRSATRPIRDADAATCSPPGSSSSSQ